MTERPILMKPHNVRAILDGKKTQTRRLIDPQPDEDGLAKIIGGPWVDTSKRSYPCPYGHTGDRLWVKETYGARGNLADGPPIRYRADVGYNESTTLFDQTRKAYGGWKGPRYMPREYSRITLELTDVRAQRLQGISEADAIAEGTSSWCTSGDMFWKSGSAAMTDARNPAFDAVNSFTGPRADYAMVWEEINGSGTWDLNPWVWALTFKRVET